MIKPLIQFLFLYAYTWGIVFPLTFIFKFNYINNYKKISLYFLSNTIILIVIFHQRLVPFLRNFTLIPFLFLFCFYVALIYLYKTQKNKMVVVDEHLKRPIRHLLRMDYRYIVSKSCDIFFQQTFLLITYSLLSDAGVNLWGLMVFSLLASAFTHMFLIFWEKGEYFYSLYLTFASSLSVFFYPLIMYKIRYGFIYTIIEHWVVGYIILGLLIQRKYKKRLQWKK